MGPLIYINDPENFTLSLGLRQYYERSGAGVRFQDQMAFALVDDAAAADRVLLVSAVLHQRCRHDWNKGLGGSD